MTISATVEALLIIQISITIITEQKNIIILKFVCRKLIPTFLADTDSRLFVNSHFAFMTVRAKHPLLDFSYVRIGDGINQAFSLTTETQLLSCETDSLGFHYLFRMLWLWPQGSRPHPVIFGMTAEPPLSFFLWRFYNKCWGEPTDIAKKISSISYGSALFYSAFILCLKSRKIP